ncbi:MAG TPA: DUF1223 domain-containing protein [Rhizomicrobium sp.]|jgi:hypothetical protein|nr:DUF1223 domain-containing protein [Rhizomicrobium sp.]
MTRSIAPWTAFLAVAILSTTTPAIADGPNLTVVELFQSQGCSSCPPANANVTALSERPDLLTLSFGVTYWDHLGWRDTFATEQYTNRQWDYARTFRRHQVFTPEVVVNGRADVSGLNRGALEALIRREAAPGNGPPVSIANGAVLVGDANGTAGRADVWLVRYDPNIEQVAIARGENEGRTLPHKNVVKELLNLGRWSGTPESFAIPPATQAGLRDAIIVQEGRGGPIIAAARSPS